MDMNTIETRGPSLRRYQRRKIMLDLNSPPSDIREQEGTSQQVGLEEATGHPIQPVPLDTIDVEAIEDDVIESSATAFAEAKNNSRRSGRRTVVDVDSGWPARQTTNNQNKRRRLLPRQTVINCDHYFNLESTPQSIVRALASACYSKAQVKEIIKPQPPPPREPNFNCPICMGSSFHQPVKWIIRTALEWSLQCQGNRFFKLKLLLAWIGLWIASKSFNT
ncbi:hypothetical protein V6N11_023999 [Hibiscus sabdariffa]|uniref:Uncharacterized protein n=1 Tax=Hibiscus sabdariffa TaxID=183260 RepID=A0ABR2TNU1_9ROSI